jgi:hypothetical protein
VTRPFNTEERQLAHWMLEHGSPGAIDFLPQLDSAQATLWRCPCGCASFKFAISGRTAPPGVNIIADFVFGDGDNLCGIFLFEKDGILAGLEVYGFGTEAYGSADNPLGSLPSPDSLRPFQPSV